MHCMLDILTIEMVVLFIHHIFQIFIFLINNVMIKILITGGAGFIGSNFCDYFISKGHQVVCLDNFANCRLPIH